MITDFFQKTIVVTVPSPSVLDEIDIAPTILPTRQPYSPGVLKVSINDATSGGTVNVYGSVNNSPDNEGFIFSSGGDHYDFGRKIFSALSTISVVGITAGTINIEAFKASGQPIFQEIHGLTTYGMTQVKPEHKAGELASEKFGEFVIGNYDLMVMYNPIYVARNFVYDGAKKYKISFSPLRSHFNHVICDLIFIEDSAGYPVY